MKIVLPVAIAATSLSLMASPATAAVPLLHYSFSPGSYFDVSGTAKPASVMGSFDFNPATGALSNVDYTSVFGHYFTGSEYTPGISSQIFFGTFGTPNYDVFQLAGNLTAGGTISINTGTNPVNYITAAGSLTDATAGAVPEPATWAMMLLGFGGIGFVMRRNRTSARVTA